MPAKKTHEEYAKQIEKIKDKPIECLGVYQGNHISILHRCRRCGHKWNIEPNAITSGGKGCPKCAKQYRRSHEEYLEELTKVNPSIKCLGVYKNALTPILHECTIHGIKWLVAPNNLLCAKPSTGGRRQGCKKCGYERAQRTLRVNGTKGGPPIGKYLKSTEEYKQELESLNLPLICLGEYIGNKYKILHRCTLCKHEWLVKPNGVLSSGNGCPICASSRGEKEILNLLNHWGLKFEFDKMFKEGNPEHLEPCRNKRYLMFDFWLPYFNLLIEYQGTQHYIEWRGAKSGRKMLRDIRHRDHTKVLWSRRKTQVELGIRLLRIPHTIKNIEKFLDKRLHLGSK
jgi:hypothetical protein